MKESAQAALSLVKAQAQELGIEPTLFDQSDIHVHVPAGAIPKDGPSAGITLASALISALTGRPVRSNVAMTGEVTLRGRVLPIGGLKEKALAAHRAGIEIVIMPDENKRDIDDIPLNVREKLRFLPVNSMDEVLAAALEKPLRRAPMRHKIANAGVDNRDIILEEIDIEKIDDIDIERINEIPVVEDPPIKLE
jgi:ATP-dependent Lon protease